MMSKDKATKVKRNVQDTIFHNLFSDPKNMVQMYKELHPEEQDVGIEDLQIVTLEDIIVNRMHNDLGFTVGKRLIVLMEAQSTWSINILVRQFMYLGQTYHDLIIDNRLDIYGTKKIDIPKPELYIVYTGDTIHNQEKVSLNKEFFDGQCWAIDLHAKVIYNSDGKSLLNQYIFFCRIWHEQRKICKNRQEAIENTLRICISAGVLADYLSHRQKEVIDMMKLLYDQDLIDEIHDYNVKKEEREKVSAEYEKEIADKNAELADKDAELADKDAEMNKMAAEIAALRKLLKEQN